MPFTAKIKRDDPFCSADQREIYAIRRRIAGAAEHCSLAGYFPNWAKARAMPHRMDRSGIAVETLPAVHGEPRSLSRTFAKAAKAPSG